MLTGQEPANDVPQQFLWPKITKLSSSYKLIQNQTTQKKKLEAPYQIFVLSKDAIQNPKFERTSSLVEGFVQRLSNVA